MLVYLFSSLILNPNTHRSIIFHFLYKCIPFIFSKTTNLNSVLCVSNYTVNICVRFWFCVIILLTLPCTHCMLWHNLLCPPRANTLKRIVCVHMFNANVTAHVLFPGYDWFYCVCYHLRDVSFADKLRKISVIILQNVIA